MLSFFLDKFPAFLVPFFLYLLYFERGIFHGEGTNGTVVDEAHHRRGFEVNADDFVCG